MSKTEKPYRKIVHWLFAVFDEVFWEVTSFSENMIEVEEYRKNGQEDTHVYLTLHLENDGKWKIEEDDIEMLATYYGKEFVGAIEDHFNKYGLPNEKNAS